MTITDREARLKSALQHAVYRNHKHSQGCDGCLDIAAWLTVPGYDGELAHPLLRIGAEAV